MDRPQLEYRSPRECQYGKCPNIATVDVIVRLPSYGSADGGTAAVACAAHVGPMAELLRDSLRDTYAHIVEGLTG